MVGAVDKGSSPTSVTRGFDSLTCRLMWVEFVVGSRLVLRFFSGFSGFPPSTKTNTSKFQFDLDVDQGHKFISKWLLRAKKKNC